VTDTDLLVQRAVDGDAEAFGRLYDMHVDRIYRHIYYRVGNKADAEDLTQEVFFKAWKAIGRYKKTGSPFLAWMMTICHNQIVDSYRKRKDETYLDDDLPVADNGPGPELAAEMEFDRKQVRRCIRRLGNDQQQVILLRFIEDFSYGEIAASLGKSEGAVRVIQHRALLKLRDIMEKEKEAR